MPPLTSVNQKVYNMRRQMREGADISALSEVFPCIPHGRVALTVTPFMGSVPIEFRACRRGKWYNMQQIDMSNEKPMGIAAKVPRVRYSAAYPTGRELLPRRETKITVVIYCGNQV